MHFSSYLLLKWHTVPIVAIFTKFDIFVEDQLQELMENAENSENPDEEELEQQAAILTMEKFERHYKGILLKKLCPPQAVVAVSNSQCILYMFDHRCSNELNILVHTSTPMDGRFTELMNATSKALNVKTNKSDTRGKLKQSRLTSLFASAQMADLKLKYKASVRYVGHLVYCI